MHSIFILILIWAWMRVTGKSYFNRLIEASGLAAYEGMSANNIPEHKPGFDLQELIRSANPWTLTWASLIAWGAIPWLMMFSRIDQR